MAALKDRIQNALDESRMLVLGVQVLLGFHFSAMLEPRFEALARPLRLLTLAGLALIVVVFAMLLVPTIHHLIVERGHETERLSALTDSSMQLVLPVLMLAICLDVYIATGAAVGGGWALLLASCVGGIGMAYLLLLQGARAARLRRHGMPVQLPSEQVEDTPLKDRIRHALTESRIVLPGAQALLGFQFITVFLSSFAELPQLSKWVHVVSLMFVTLSTMLLIAPAALHRVVYRGDDSESFLRTAGKMVLLSLVPLGLGIAGDVYVVTQRVAGSERLGAAAALATLACLFGLWFGFTFWQRSRSSVQESGTDSIYRPGHPNRGRTSAAR